MSKRLTIQRRGIEFCSAYSPGRSRQLACCLLVENYSKLKQSVYFSQFHARGMGTNMRLLRRRCGYKRRVYGRSEPKDPVFLVKASGSDPLPLGRAAIAWISGSREQLRDLDFQLQL